MDQLGSVRGVLKAAEGRRGAEDQACLEKLAVAKTRGRVAQLLGAARAEAPGLGDTPGPQGGGPGGWGQCLTPRTPAPVPDGLAPAPAPPHEGAASPPPRPAQPQPSGAGT